MAFEPNYHGNRELIEIGEELESVVHFKYQYGRGRWRGNGIDKLSGDRLEKLEKKFNGVGLLCDRMMPTKQ